MTTATATVYATGTPFALKVTDYTPNPNAADQHYPDPTGDYINYDSSAGSTFDPAIQSKDAQVIDTSQMTNIECSLVRPEHL